MRMVYGSRNRFYPTVGNHRAGTGSIQLVGIPYGTFAHEQLDAIYAFVPPERDVFALDSRFIDPDTPVSPALHHLIETLRARGQVVFFHTGDADQENLLLGGEEEEEEEQAELEEYVESEPSGTTTEAVERRNRLFRILLIPVGIALFLLVLLFANRLFRSQAPQEVEEGNLDALKRELARAVRVSLRDMLRSTDYRAAVIACYARMEEILGRHGFPRRAYQTPLEYMASTLQRAARIPNGNADTPKELLPDKALLDLTRLFEVAKFSTHPMSRKDMDRAVGYLTEIGDRLSTEVFRAEEVAG